MTMNVSRRSLLALGAGLGASTVLGGTALAKAPRLRTQPAYFYRFELGGVVDESGKVLFPNAQFYIAQSDLDFWTDEGKADGSLKDFIVHARRLP